jgi:hypothetical protein
MRIRTSLRKGIMQFPRTAAFSVIKLAIFHHFSIPRTLIAKTAVFGADNQSGLLLPHWRTCNGLLQQVLVVAAKQQRHSPDDCQHIWHVSRGMA